MVTETDREEWDRLKAEIAERLRQETQAAQARRLAKRQTPKRVALAVFGRFNPPTTGHERLYRYLLVEAVKREGVPFIFPSPTAGDSRNPLPFAEKVSYLRLLFPSAVVNGNPKVRNPLDALKVLRALGFEAVYFVVGSDQTREFAKFAPYAKDLKQFGVLTVPEARSNTAPTVAGMSATKLREAAQAGNYLKFRAGSPTRATARISKQIFDSVRRHLDGTQHPKRHGVSALRHIAECRERAARVRVASYARPARHGVRPRLPE